MSTGTFQKASLTALAWLILYFSTSGIVYWIIWPSERRIAAMRAGHFYIDVSPPLPVGGHLLIYGVPTGVVSLLIVLYRRGCRL